MESENSKSKADTIKVADGSGSQTDLSSETSTQSLIKNDVETLTDDAPTRLVLLLTLASSLSGFSFGYDTGYISSALVQVGTDLSNKVLTNGEKEFITSSTSLGALLGAVVGGILANLLGRRIVLLGSNVLFVIGTIIQLASKTVWTMIVGRFVLGWGVGIASLISPLMLSELAPSRYRGRLIVTNGMLITGGQLVAYFINWGLTRVDHGWRVSVGLCLVPAVAQFLLFWFLPDTPRYYIINNDITNAKVVLKKVYKNVSDVNIDAMVEEMILSNSNVPGNGPLSRAWESIKLIHTTPSNFRALILACGLQGIQQFTGFNSLMYFSSTIFETCGFDNPTAVSIIIAATNFVFTFIALCTIDKIGRRRTLVFAIPCMCISLVVCAIGFHFLGISFADSDNVVIKSSGITGWGIVIILSMVWFVASYAIGIGTSAWTGVELFSDVNVRSMGAMFATCTNWSGSLVIASTFLTMLENITPTGTFSFFAGLCFVSFFFVYFLYPEVAGLELEETNQLLASGFNVREAAKLSKERKKRLKYQSTSDQA
ncbi:myo-inositol transporter 1 [[Candida] jaroonii]|uniref:Myo-inositol transporter 1 n=1 Tax=[Candida] jaroonii TaxID=467808 RepID=A0ACA9Y3A7_9ASCO|nr:myo-inositol transporter 1 [[Candida] jaroonii]